MAVSGVARPQIGSLRPSYYSLGNPMPSASEVDSLPEASAIFFLPTASSCTAASFPADMLDLVVASELFRLVLERPNNQQSV
jgi:hypothetical protein